MKNWSSNPIIWSIISALFVLAIYLFLSKFSPVGDELKSAAANYHQGEKATTIADRQTDFNNTLATYLKMTQDYTVDGKVYFNMANTYFQLEQYPMAVLNYTRALKLMPRDDKVKRNLEITLNKLGLAPQTSDSVFDKIFFFHNYLSLPERLQIIFLMTILFFLACSAYIWTNKSWLKPLIGLITLVGMVFLGSAFYTQFIAPTEGIIVNSTMLYRDAGEQYAKVSDQPVAPGTKVQVLDTALGGLWLKVMTPDGKLGYVSNQTMRII